MNLCRFCSSKTLADMITVHQIVLYCTGQGILQQYFITFRNKNLVCHLWQTLSLSQGTDQLWPSFACVGDAGSEGISWLALMSMCLTRFESRTLCNSIGIPSDGSANKQIFKKLPTPRWKCGKRITYILFRCLCSHIVEILSSFPRFWADVCSWKHVF